jgi:CubicO group peptidase (beta-lactamase class C family)
MKAYWAANVSEPSLARRSMEERLLSYRQMRGDVGQIELARVLAVQPDAITALMRTSKREWLKYRFEFEAGTDPKLAGIRVEFTQGPLREERPGASGPVLSTPAPRDDRPAPERLAEYGDRVAATGFTGALLVEKNGAILYERGFGMADRARGLPITRDTVFSIGSNTKDLTAVAILQLEARGKLSLSDPIGKYFSGVPADKQAVTIEMLLGHRAGLESNYGSGDAEAVGREELVRRVLTAPLRTPPGKEFHYSNAGYSLLAAVLEKVAGQPYERYFAENIFQPAGMTRTGFSLVAWKPGEVAHGYVDGKDWGTILDRPHAPDGPYWNLRGNGGIHSTLRDMAAFYRALWRDVLVPRAEREKKFPSGKPLTVAGSNLVFFFVYVFEPQDQVAVLAASTDAGMPAEPVARDASRIARGEAVLQPPRFRRIGPAPGPPRQQSGPGLPAPEIARELEAFVERLSAEGSFSGVVLLAKDGKPLLAKS